MNIYISGYGEKDILTDHAAGGTGGQVTWLDPETFFSRAGQVDTGSDHHWIWVYRPPWSLLLDTKMCHETVQEDVVQQWSAWQRQALKLRHTHPAVHLVNRDQTFLDDALAHLGLAKTEQTPTQNNPSDLSLALGKLFAWIEPAQWDVFESLELAAINVHGDPMDRHTLPLPSREVIQEMSRLIMASSALPEKEMQLEEQSRLTEELRNETNQLQKQVVQLQDTIEQKKKTFESEKKNLTEENELLLLQLHQVQEELERYFLAHQEMSTSLEKARTTMDQARSLIARMSA